MHVEYIKQYITSVRGYYNELDTRLIVINFIYPANSLTCIPNLPAPATIHFDVIIIYDVIDAGRSFFKDS